MTTNQIFSRRTTVLSAALLAALISAGASASPGYGRDGEGRYEHDQYSDYAKVLKVTPIYRNVQVAVPQRQCWDEQVVHNEPGRGYGGYQSYTPHIIGGVAGGVIGNRFGKGTGNTLMTVAGALLGGSIGRDHSDRQRRYANPGYSYTTTETRCQTTNSYRSEERADGYRVKYRYNGRTYTTRMNRAPGDKIRVEVQVVPTY